MLVCWAVLASAPAAAEPVPPIWESEAADQRPLDIDLVRADVLIERSAGRTSVQVRAAPANGAARIEVTQRSDGVRIVDAYPARSSIVAARECLPPVDARGDYWSYPVRFVVHVRLRDGQPLRVRVQQGDIRVADAGQNLDLATASGAVIRDR